MSENNIQITPVGTLETPAEVGSAFVEEYGEGSWAVKVIAPAPDKPGILCVTPMKEFADMMAQYWSAGWFTSGTAVTAVSNLRLSANDTTVFVIAEIDGRNRIVFQASKRFVGHADAGAVGMLKGGIVLSRNGNVAGEAAKHYRCDNCGQNYHGKITTAYVCSRCGGSVSEIKPN